MQKIITLQIENSIEVKTLLLKNQITLKSIEQAVNAIVKAYKAGNKVLIAGNGGSAADAQHMAGELVSRFYLERAALPAIALTTDSSILTAIANDYDYDKIFLRQIQAYAKANDIYFAISTSGNSKNIVQSLAICKDHQLTTIGLSGKQIGIMDQYCDIMIKIDSIETPRIQEAHLLIEHIICALVEKQLFA